MSGLLVISLMLAPWRTKLCNFFTRSAKIRAVGLSVIIFLLLLNLPSLLSRFFFDVHNQNEQSIFSFFNQLFVHGFFRKLGYRFWFIRDILINEANRINDPAFGKKRGQPSNGAGGDAHTEFTLIKSFQIFRFGNMFLLQHRPSGQWTTHGREIDVEKNFW